jgi:UPF0042 nucleotide-binding protein
MSETEAHDMNPIPRMPVPITFVTGPSGAGRSTAIAALEDLGHEVIDNLPLSLVPRLLNGPATHRPLALGVDARNRDFSVERLLELIQRLRSAEGVALQVLFIDCAPDTLLRRFSETRRRHPMAPYDTPENGIAAERDLLAPVREAADILIDTSDYTIHDLRREVEHWFGPSAGGSLAISLQSFSYKRGLPRGLDMVFDVRFLRNPHWAPALRSKTGMDHDVVAHIAQDDRFAAFRDQVASLLHLLLPAYVQEGKSHFSVGFGCTGGQHRSVAVAETLAAGLAAEGWKVSVRHRELERRGHSGRVSDMG